MSAAGKRPAAAAMRSLALFSLHAEYGPPQLTPAGDALRECICQRLGAAADDDPIVARGVARLVHLILLVESGDRRPGPLVIEALDALGMAGERGAPGIATNSALRGWCLLLLLGSQIWPSDLSWLSDGSAEAGCWLGGQRLMRTGVSADASAQALGNLLDLLSRALDDWLDGDQEAWCAVPAPLVAAAAEFSRRAISTSQILGPAGANQALLGLLAVALTDLAESQAALSAEIARAAIIAVAAGSPVLIAAAAGATRQGCA